MHGKNMKVVNVCYLLNVFSFSLLDIENVPVWQKAHDFLQNLIDAQQNEGKNGKQSKGEHTVPSHLHNVTLCRCNWQESSYLHCCVQVWQITRSYLKGLCLYLVGTKRAPALWAFLPTAWQETPRPWNACRTRSTPHSQRLSSISDWILN